MAALRFESLPRFLRQAAVLAVGWRNRRRRFGAEYAAWSSLLQESNAWSQGDRDAWQRSRLAELVRITRLTTPAYQDALPEAERIGSAASLEGALAMLPVLQKESLRANPHAHRNAAVKECAETSTSGSTGSPMKVGHDAPSIQRRFAFLQDHLRLAGVSARSPSVRLSGRILAPVGSRQTKPWLINQLERQMFLSSYHLDNLHAPVVAGKLLDFAPVLLDGYPSGILETLRLVDRQGAHLNSLRAVITTAETLHLDMRAEIESLSGVPVMDYYAASEGVPLIQQCPFGTYHVRWQSGIFEVDTGAGIFLEGSGELICTSFVQDRTPLIRYRTGDSVEGLTRGAVACKCGLRTPAVGSVQGRLEDLVYTPDGRALGMFTYRTLKQIPELGETQVIQHDFAVFEVNSVVLPTLDLDQVRDEISCSFERVLGYPVEIRLHRVERIARGAGGKLRLVISKVARAQTCAR